MRRGSISKRPFHRDRDSVSYFIFPMAIHCDYNTHFAVILFSYSPHAKVTVIDDVQKHRLCPICGPGGAAAVPSVVVSHVITALLPLPTTHSIGGGPR